MIFTIIKLVWVTLHVYTCMTHTLCDFMYMYIVSCTCTLPYIHVSMYNIVCYEVKKWWFNVFVFVCLSQAAFGGCCLYSKQHRSLMAGSERYMYMHILYYVHVHVWIYMYVCKIFCHGNHRADSVTWDIHKSLSAPLQCSAFITKHKVCNTL